MGRVILKNNRYQFLISIVVILLVLTILGVGNAPPILPSSFYGTVMVYGAYVSDGTIISAWIDGNKYALLVTASLGLEESGGLVCVGPVHYNTVEEIMRFGEVLGEIATS